MRPAILGSCFRKSAVHLTLPQPRTRYTRFMLRIALALLIAGPAFAAAPHSGVAGPRSMPELSDLALFACAAFSVWFVRHRLRARFRGKAPKD